MIDKEKMVFKYFISLGHSCPVAASMSKYGLRSCSGPFDWLVTRELEWVLHFIENEFEDFLKYENLEMFQDNTLRFREKTSGFLFVHEEYTYDKNYDQLFHKYKRRINKFIELSKFPCCFIRAVSDSKEIEYIKENYAYIKRVIEKNNKNNQIVFLIKEDIMVENLPFPFWNVRGEYSGETRELLQGWFEGAGDFLDWCAKHMDAQSMMKNITYFYQKEKENIYNVKISNRYNILVKLLGYNFIQNDIPENVIIYGAGNIGKAFYERIRTICNVKCFIDENSKEKAIDGISILRLYEIDFKKKIPIIVTATYDYKKIENEIMTIDKDAEVISLEDVLKMN